VTERTYGQFCPIAAGLDVIGDRWVLLILRELSIGERRFTDLRNDLPGIAPNLLSERLRTLQAAGLVETAELPPPAARTVYRLTDEGRRVQPVLRSVARFGAHFLEGEPGQRLDARRTAHALLVPWWRATGEPLHARVVVDGDDEIDLVVDASVSVSAPSGTPDVTLHVARRDLAESRRTDEPLVAQITGPASARRSFLEQFDLQLARKRGSSKKSR
jgi:DNA-binding HxlR family transcriptional regulator